MACANMGEKRRSHERNGHENKKAFFYLEMEKKDSFVQKRRKTECSFWKTKLEKEKGTWVWGHVTSGRRGAGGGGGGGGGGLDLRVEWMLVERVGRQLDETAS